MVNKRKVLDMLKLNEQYNWKEIQEHYPEQWVIITDVEEKEGEIIRCRLLEVCSNTNKAECIGKYLNTDIHFLCERTTFRAPNVGMFC